MKTPAIKWNEISYVRRQNLQNMNDGSSAGILKVFWRYPEGGRRILPSESVGYEKLEEKNCRNCHQNCKPELPTGIPDEPGCQLPPQFGRTAYSVVMQKTNLARKEKKVGAKLLGNKYQMATDSETYRRTLRAKTIFGNFEKRSIWTDDRMNSNGPP